MNPDKVQDLVTIAFTLEAISDKKGCTTRYVDLPERSLSDFLIAGINASKYFRKLAQDIEKGKNPEIFGYFLKAIETANHLKSPKTVNFGLLEIMFPTVYARLISENKNKVIDKIIELMKRGTNKDVGFLIEVRKEAWKSSANPLKKNFTGEKFIHLNSPYEMYLKFLTGYPESHANHQWAKEYQRGLPILREFFESFRNVEKLLEEIKIAFNTIKEKNPQIKTGIIADMCAAAIFLFLSFQKK